jgi:hypothetical protein
MKTINLTQGQVAFVDDEDFESLNAYKWHAYKNKRLNPATSWYAARTVTVSPKKQARVPMQRQILGLALKAYPLIDHRDGNGLNNQRENLRLATVQQNIQNRPKLPGSWKSSFKGVDYHPKTHKWRARICINYKSIFIGLFGDEFDAALAYNLKAVELFGDFARCNVVAP